MIKKIFVLFVCILSVANVSHAEILTLDSLIKQSLDQHPQVKSFRMESQADQSEADQKSLMSNPTIDGAFRFDEDGDHKNSEFEVKFDVLDLVLRPMKNKVKKIEFERIKTQLDKDLSQFILDVKISYLDTLITEKVYQKWKDYHDFLDQKSKIMEKQFKEGALSRVDFQRHQLNLFNVESSSKEAFIDWSTQKKNLAFYLNSDKLTETLQLNDQILNLPEKEQSLEFYVQNISNHWDIQKLNIEIQNLKQSLRMSDYESWLNVETGVLTEKDDGEDRLIGPSFAWEIPIFNRGKSHKERLKYLIENHQSQLELKKSEFQIKVEEAYTKMIFYRDQIAKFEDQIVSIDSSLLDLSLKSYESSQQTINDFFQDQNLSLDLKLRHLDNLKKYWESKFWLETNIVD